MPRTRQRPGLSARRLNAPSRTDGSFKNAVRDYKRRRLEELFAPGFVDFLSELSPAQGRVWRERCGRAAGLTRFDRVGDLVVVENDAYRIGMPERYSLACRWLWPIKWEAVFS